MKKQKMLKVDEHLKEEIKRTAFRELYELEEQKLQIAKKIVGYRIKHNLTQEQLAKKIKVSQQYISKIEKGEFFNIPSLEKVLVPLGYKVKLEAVPLRTKISHDLNNLKFHSPIA
jgi:DNA-binding XRE family transcriptional regulator